MQAIQFHPDYAKSVEEVYSDITLTILNSSRNLDVLSIPRGTTERSAALPSWSIDWSDTSSHASQLDTTDFTIINHPSTREFSASRGTFCSVSDLGGGNKLRLVGHVFDCISELGSPLSPSLKAIDIQRSKAEIPEIKSFWEFGENILGNAQKAISESRNMLDTLIEWENIAGLDQDGCYPTGEDHTTVYWRTLCIDQKAGKSDAEVAAAFQRWRRILRWPRLLNTFRGNSESLVWDWAVPLSAFLFGNMSYNERDFGEMIGWHFFRRLVRTERGYLGLVPQEAKRGDHVAILKGGRTPFIVRPRGSSWELVGECYIHGVMDGEGFDEHSCVEMNFS
jgi:hypothetical protein